MTTWREVSARAGRNDLPGLLAVHWSELSREDLAEAVTRSWTVAEWPEQHIDQQGWRMLWDEVGYSEDGVVAARALPEIVTLYRGATEERRHGMSWTDSVEQARWFATRFAGTRLDTGGGGRVWRISIPSDFVLAVIHGRGESEYVVDTLDFDPDEYEDVTDGERRR